VNGDPLARRLGAVLQCRPRRRDGPQGVAVGVRDRVAAPAAPGITMPPSVLLRIDGVIE